MRKMKVIGLSRLFVRGFVQVDHEHGFSFFFWDESSIPIIRWDDQKLDHVLVQPVFMLADLVETGSKDSGRF